MPRVKPGQRKRAYVPKVRSGCRTCKIRRVKCTEEKPQCSRCTSTGRRCDGYEAVTTIDKASLTRYWTPLQPYNANEGRALQFFRERTSAQIAGFYECDFWHGIILQMAAKDEGVHHALVAFASLHEEFEKGGIGKENASNFALSQYSIALQKNLALLTGSTRPATLEAYLCPCLIFICIEMIRGRIGSALGLVKKAINVLHEVVDDDKLWASPSSQELARIFEATLNNLETQAVALLGRDNWGATHPPKIRARTWVPTMPFKTVADARNCLTFYIHTFTLTQRKTVSTTRSTANSTTPPAATPPAEKPSDMTNALTQYFQIYLQWSDAFDALLAQGKDKFTSREIAAAKVLHVLRLMYSSTFDLHSRGVSDLEDNQMLWDNYTWTFSEVVRIAERILARSKNPVFTLDQGTLVGPLYDIARRCRDPFVRREAVRVMYAYPRQEGMYYSVLAAMAAERVIEVEESRIAPKVVQCCLDVPRWARVTDAAPTFDIEERMATLRYRCFANEHDLKGYVMEEHLTW